MLKKVLLTSTLIASSFLNVAFASAPTDASIQKVAHLTNINQILTESMQNVGTIVEQQAIQIVQKKTGHNSLNAQEQKAAQDIAKILKNNTDQFVQRANLPALINQLFKKYYSEEELLAYIKFLETPEGQSINKKQPLVLQETMQNIANVSNSPETKESRQYANQQITDILKSLPKEK